MQVLVHTDTNIDGHEDQVDRIVADVESAFEQFSHHLTRIEVHLRDESAGRQTGDDIRCLLEARPTGREPVVVTHHASNVTEALGGASSKLDALLTSSFERRVDKHGRDTIRGH